MNKQPKYIFVTGGVLSGVGKGIVAASVGKILQESGINVSVQKLDPYINVDPGTMSPYQHGEVFVTDDGAETDLDLGHYERFLDINLKKVCSVTAGQIYAEVIAGERRGDYLGGTIQVVPHITKKIKEKINHAVKETGADVLIVEIGGTVGDIESAPFLEAVRQLRAELNNDQSICIHVTWVPYLQSSKELKTKPTQNSLRDLRSIGITPDLVILRADYPIGEQERKKIALFGNIKHENVIPLTTQKNMYLVPACLQKFSIGFNIMHQLHLIPKQTPMKPSWAILDQELSHTSYITIGIVGKYTQLHDAYISVKEAIKHAGADQKIAITIAWINAEEINHENVGQLLNECDGIIVPGGFGDRGIEGKIIAARWARKNNKPYLGICLGMHVMCIEFARHILNDSHAHSFEFDPQTKNPIISLMDTQFNVTQKGGTMRLGSYPCAIRSETKTSQAYGAATLIHERHRHRYEFNNSYRTELEKAGMVFSGLSPDGNLVEIVELKDHPFMIGAQFHPEFLSRPEKAHPLFDAFIKATMGKSI
jgi:CTP synthase